MNTRSIIRLLLSCSAVLCCLMATSQTKQAFQTFPGVFAEGETIRIVYRPQLAGHNDSAGVRASVYLYRNFAWEGHDLDIKKTDTGWVSSYQLPDGAALVAFHFLLGDSIDKGEHFPYAALVHDRSGRMARGAYTEWALFRNKESNGMPSYLIPAASLVQPDANKIWLPKELRDSIVVRNCLPGIARTLKITWPDKSDSLLRMLAAYVLRQPDLTERQLIYVQKLYEHTLRDRNVADSLQTAVISRFPGGLMDRTHRIAGIYMQRDSIRKAAARAAFFSEFPMDKYPFEDYLDPEAGDPSMAGHLYIEMAMRAFNAHRWDELTKLIHDCPFSYLDYIYQHDVMYPFRTDNPSITIKEALDISTVIVDELLSRVKDTDPRRSGRNFIAPAEWLQHVMTMDSGIFGYHLDLMVKNGELEKGYQLARQLEPYIHATSLTFNDAYVKLLHGIGKDEEAVPFIRRAIFANAATPEMVRLLEEDYKKTHGSATGFLVYYQSLRSQEAIKKEEAKLDKEMVNVPGLTFRLKDMAGKTIDLASLKGKIVVLDFWATWCFPCKSAMPGMQMAVNKYKQDPSVVFYFISTMEERPDYKKSITSFLKEKNYDFHVLLDDQYDSAYKRGGAVFGKWGSVLKMSGIPQKVIIDQAGVVRWVTGGFYGNVIDVADEVSYVIDRLKKGS